MPGGIFLLQGGDTLVEMTEKDYDSEELLQKLLADYPNLLAGDQIDSDSPRRWLLIGREVGVPLEEAGGNAMSLDHLFLDQDGVPTLVEVKRSSDVRIRREVIGQMLDYAANASAYWPADQIQQLFEQRCEAEKQDPDEILAAFLQDDADADSFWQEVRTNLQAGRIRLVFAADVIPSALRRVVEFLNEQMAPAEVLALEVRQYVAEGLRAMVPRVFGQTGDALQRKGHTPRERFQWDEAKFFATLESYRNADEAGIARRIFEWAKDHKLRVSWGSGRVYGSCFPWLDYNGISYCLFVIYTYGKVEMQFEGLARRAPFDQRSLRPELLQRLNRLRGVSIPETKLDKRPSIALSLLSDETALGQFLETMEWALQVIQAA